MNPIPKHLQLHYALLLIPQYSAEGDISAVSNILLLSLRAACKGFDKSRHHIANRLFAVVLF